MRRRIARFGTTNTDGFRSDWRRRLLASCVSPCHDHLDGQIAQDNQEIAQSVPDSYFPHALQRQALRHITRRAPRHGKFTELSSPCNRDGVSYRINNETLFLWMGSICTHLSILAIDLSKGDCV